MPTRSFGQSMKFIERIQGCTFRIKKGFVPNMKVEGRFYVNERLESLMLDELRHFCDAQGVGGFLPAVTQISNVASLPGIVGASMAMPDVHSGYGFSIGNVRVVGSVEVFNLPTPQCLPVCVLHHCSCDLPACVARGARTAMVTTAHNTLHWSFRAGGSVRHAESGSHCVAGWCGF